MTEAYTELLQENSELEAKILRLEQENKELKEVKEQLKKWNDENLKRQDDMQLWIDLAEEQRRNYRSALEEIREKAQHCIKQDICTLCDYSKECAVPDADGLVYDNNRLLIKLINEVLGNESK